MFAHPLADVQQREPMYCIITADCLLLLASRNFNNQLLNCHWPAWSHGTTVLMYEVNSVTGGGDGTVLFVLSTRTEEERLCWCVLSQVKGSDDDRTGKETC